MAFETTYRSVCRKSKNDELQVKTLFYVTIPSHLIYLRCRSAFKLIEIDDRFKILQPGHTVIDCGAAPGSWTQVAVKRVNSDFSDSKQPQGIVVSIDKQQVFPINVSLAQIVSRLNLSLQGGYSFRKHGFYRPKITR